MHTHDGTQTPDGTQPSTNPLVEKFEQLRSHNASEEILEDLGDLLYEAELAGDTALYDKIRAEIGSVTYELDPEFDATYQQALEGDSDAFNRYTAMMEAKQMPREVYPDDYDDLLVRLSEGVPLPTSFKTSLVDDFENLFVAGLVQLQAHKAIRMADVGRAGYLLSLYHHRMSETEGLFGPAVEQIMYKLGDLVGKYKADFD